MLSSTPPLLLLDQNQTMLVVVGKEHRPIRQAGLCVSKGLAAVVAGGLLEVLQEGIQGT